MNKKLDKFLQYQLLKVITYQFNPSYCYIYNKCLWYILNLLEIFKNQLQSSYWLKCYTISTCVSPLTCILY